MDRKKEDGEKKKKMKLPTFLKRKKSDKRNKKVSRPKVTVQQLYKSLNSILPHKKDLLLTVPTSPSSSSVSLPAVKKRVKIPKASKNVEQKIYMSDLAEGSSSTTTGFGSASTVQTSLDYDSDHRNLFSRRGPSSRLLPGQVRSTPISASNDELSTSANQTVVHLEQKTRSGGESVDMIDSDYRSLPVPYSLLEQEEGGSSSTSTDSGENPAEVYREQNAQNRSMPVLDSSSDDSDLQNLPVSYGNLQAEGDRSTSTGIGSDELSASATRAEGRRKQFAQRGRCEVADMLEPPDEDSAQRHSGPSSQSQPGEDKSTSIGSEEHSSPDNRAAIRRKRYARHRSRPVDMMEPLDEDSELRNLISPPSSQSQLGEDRSTSTSIGSEELSTSAEGGKIRRKRYARRRDRPVETMEPLDEDSEVRNLISPPFSQSRMGEGRSTSTSVGNDELRASVTRAGERRKQYARSRSRPVNPLEPLDEDYDYEPYVRLKPDEDKSTSSSVGSEELSASAIRAEVLRKQCTGSGGRPVFDEDSDLRNLISPQSIQLQPGEDGSSFTSSGSNEHGISITRAEERRKQYARSRGTAVPLDEDNDCQKLQSSSSQSQLRELRSTWIKFDSDELDASVKREAAMRRKQYGRSKSWSTDTLDGEEKKEKKKKRKSSWVETTLCLEKIRESLNELSARGEPFVLDERISFVEEKQIETAKDNTDAQKLIRERDLKRKSPKSTHRRLVKPHKLVDYRNIPPFAGPSSRLDEIGPTPTRPRRSTSRSRRSSSRSRRNTSRSRGRMQSTWRCEPLRSDSEPHDVDRATDSSDDGE